MKNFSKNRNYQLFSLIVSCIAVYFIIWAFCGYWPWCDNQYNSYVLQAKAWLSGRLDLGRDYDHLEIALFGGKFFVSFPPLPSALLVPFVLLNIPDGFAAPVFGLLGAVFAFKLCEKQNISLPNFWVLFLTVASNVLLISFNSWVWFIAQNISFALTLAAIYFAVAKRGTLSFLFLALAIGCRPFQAIYFPLLLIIITDNGKLLNFKKILRQLIPAIIVGIAYMFLNFVSAMYSSSDTTIFPNF